MIADTSGLLAFFDADEPAHADTASVVAELIRPLAVSDFVVAGLDYLVLSRHGEAAELVVLLELAGGAFDLHPTGEGSLRSSCALIRKYRDQEIGVADAHLVVMADELDTNRILTLDHRHFDVLRPLQGGRSDVLPRR